MRRNAWGSWSALSPSTAALAAAIVVTPPVLAQDKHLETWENWGQPFAERLRRFIPIPPPGLADSLPWQAPSAVSTDANGCHNGCPRYFSFRAEKRWFEYDSAIVAELRAIKGRSEALIARISRQPPVSEMQRLQRESDSLDRRNEELQRKLSGSVVLRIGANETPEFLLGPTEPAGKLKGYTFYRNGQWFAVHVGPPGFTNPLGPVEQERREVKAFLVSVNFEPPTGEVSPAEERLVRQLLERVDYAGLAKLLTP